MNNALGPITRIGDIMLAAISRVRVVSKGWSSGGAIWAEKTPVALLIARDGVVSGVAPDGTTLSNTEIEALCPGALSAMSAGLERRGFDED